MLSKYNKINNTNYDCLIHLIKNTKNLVHSLRNFKSLFSLIEKSKNWILFKRKKTKFSLLNKKKYISMKIWFKNNLIFCLIQIKLNLSVDLLGGNVNMPNSCLNYCLLFCPTERY